MGRLVVLNGLPGSGKSTLAARYTADRPLSLCLDIDVVRELLGDWREVPSEAGHLARRVALPMAREVLLAGHDVVVPQLLARSEFLEQLEDLAGRCGVAFREVWLRQDLRQALDQLQARAAGPMSPAQRSAHAMLDRDGGAEAVIPSLRNRLLALERQRPAALSLAPIPNDPEATYRTLLALLDDPDGVEIHEPAGGRP